MISEDNKLVTNNKTGYKPITKKRPKKKETKKGYFNPDKISKNDNWLFPHVKKNNNVGNS